MYPPRCVVCDRLLAPGERIHRQCEERLFPVSGSTCMHCGSPVRDRRELCGDCNRKKKNTAKTFKQGKALYVYKGSIKESMYRFKYSNKREYALFYAQEAADRYGEWIKRQGIDAIMAVPMYRRKQKRRGYNQAEVFAKALSETTGIPYVSDMVQRQKNTAPMKNLNDVQRELNLKNAFQTKENIVQYYYILMVDDIYTTGSTADAVSEAMLSAGVKQVYFLSICIGQGY